MKDVYYLYLLLLSGLHRHKAVAILCKNAEHPWTTDQLHMPFVVLQDGARIKEAEVGRLGKVHNMPSVRFKGTGHSWS